MADGQQADLGRGEFNMGRRSLDSEIKAVVGTPGLGPQGPNDMAPDDKVVSWGAGSDVTIPRRVPATDSFYTGVRIMKNK